MDFTPPSDPSQRLIFALDVPSMNSAREYIKQLDGVVRFFKIGLELFLARDVTFFQELQDRGCHIFLDLKMCDIDETVRRTVDLAGKLGINFITILGNAATARAAAQGRGNWPIQVLFVPLLSSWGEKDLRDLHLVGPGCRFDTLTDYVCWGADQAIANGCNGLIASGEYIDVLRKRFDPPVTLVCPGIRPTGINHQEHQRTATPYDAIRNGADYLVVGRPIRDASHPREMAQTIIDDIGRGLSARAGQTSSSPAL